MPKRWGVNSEEIVSQQLVRAVGHPLRVKILAELTARGPLSPNQLKDIIEAPLGVTAYHVGKVLFQQCKVLELHSTAQRRGAVEHFYAVKPDYLMGNPVWQRELPVFLQGTAAGASLQTFIDQAFAALEGSSDELFSADLITWRKVRIDREGHGAISILLEETFERVAEIERECRRRAEVEPTGMFEAVISLSDLHVPPPEAE